jgi:hypothetical protein
VGEYAIEITGDCEGTIELEVIDGAILDAYNNVLIDTYNNIMQDSYGN